MSRTAPAALRRRALLLLPLAGIAAAAGCSPAGDAGPADASDPSSQSSASSSSESSGASPTGTAPAAEPSTPSVDGAVPAVGDPTRVVDPARVPVRLEVPALGLDVGLIELGTNPDGSLEVPVDFQEVGWFTGSAAPGDTGPAVVAGHVDSKDGPAPFFALRDLAVGDEVVVTAVDGRRSSFTVDGVQQYPKDAFPTAAVYGPAPGPVLRLVTCGGSFDRSTGHYRDNVVVFAS